MGVLTIFAAVEDGFGRLDVAKSLNLHEVGD